MTWQGALRLCGVRKPSDLIVRLVACALCSVVLAAAATAADTRAEDWTRYGQLIAAHGQLVSAGQAEPCVKHAEQLLAFVQQRFPPRLEFLGLFALAQARELQFRHEEAIKLYAQVIAQTKALQPQIEAERTLGNICAIDSLQNTGVCLRQLNRYQEALPIALQALEWHTQHNSAPLQMGAAESQLANNYRQLNDSLKAEEHYRRAAVIFERQGQQQRAMPPQLAEILLPWSGIYLDQGRFDVCEPMLRRALSIHVAARGWQHPITAKIASSLGGVFLLQGRYEDGEVYVRTGVQIYEQVFGKDHPDTLLRVQQLGHVYRVIGRDDLAEPLFRRVVAGNEAVFGRRHPSTALAIHSLAEMLVAHDNLDEAERLLSEVIDIMSSSEIPRDRDTGIQSLAMLKTKQGKFVEVQQLCDKLEAHFQQVPPGGMEQAHLHRLRAEALWKTGDKQAAVARLAQAIEQAEVQRSFTGGAERERAQALGVFATEYEMMVDWQSQLGRIAEMFSAVEGGKARSFLDELKLKNVDLFAGLPEAERRRLVEQENQLRGQLLQAENKLDKLLDQGSGGKGDFAAQRQRAVADVQQARDHLYQHLADARAASPVYRELISRDTKPASIADLQAHLADGDLVLAYSIGQFYGSHVFAIRKHSVNTTSLIVDEPAAAQLGIAAGPLLAEKLSQVLLTEKTGLLKSLADPRAAAAATRKQLAALWKVLIPEAERAGLTSGTVASNHVASNTVKLLTVIPDGPLSLLPFEALVVSDDADREYLLDVGPPVAYAPSASVLLNLAKRERHPATASQPVFTLGDPNYSAPVASAADAIDRQLGVVRAIDKFRAGLARLPYTGWESSWVQDQFTKAGLPGYKVTGAQATEAAIRQYAPGREIIHLACHGMADQTHGNFFGALAVAPGKPGDPRDDGFLTMSEIYELNLSGCELAIVSACETNYGPQQQGEGVWALSRGFLVAGARRVVASNWVVDDKAGATLVSYFATYLAKAGSDASARDVSSRDYAKALHDAKRMVRKEELWSSPFYWSSLVLVGPK